MHLDWKNIFVFTWTKIKNQHHDKRVFNQHNWLSVKLFVLILIRIDYVQYLMMFFFLFQQIFVIIKAIIILKKSWKEFSTFFCLTECLTVNPTSLSWVIIWYQNIFIHLYTIFLNWKVFWTFVNASEKDINALILKRKKSRFILIQNISNNYDNTIEKSNV